MLVDGACWWGCNHLLEDCGTVWPVQDARAHNHSRVLGLLKLLQDRCTLKYLGQSLWAFAQVLCGVSQIILLSYACQMRPLHVDLPQPASVNMVALCHPLICSVSNAKKFPNRLPIADLAAVHQQTCTYIQQYVLPPHHDYGRKNLNRLIRFSRNGSAMSCRYARTHLGAPVRWTVSNTATMHLLNVQALTWH